jgi:hypothetical protein
VTDAYAGEGFNMGTTEAKAYCKQQDFRFDSIQDCVAQAYAGDGFNMGSTEARQYCEGSGRR